MTVYTLPSAAEFISGIQAWSATMFTEMLPIVYVTIGLTAAVCFFLFLIDVFSWAFTRFFSRGYNDRRDEYEAQKDFIDWKRWADKTLK